MLSGVERKIKEDLADEPWTQARAQRHAGRTRFMTIELHGKVAGPLRSGFRL